MIENKVLDLGKGPIFPLLLKMSWPSITAMLAMAVANLIDTFWLARLSTQALAALTVCFPIQMIFGAIGVGTGVGAGSFAARMFGAGQHEKAQQTAGQVILLSIALGILTMIPVLIGHDAILRGFGATDDIMLLARQYLVLIVLGSPFLYFLMMVNNLLRAEGRPQLSMYVVLTLSLVLMVLEPFLIFGWGFFPKLGIAGAALAAVISQMISAAVSFYFLQLSTSRYHLTRRHLVPSLSICRSIYQTGFPSVIMNLVVSLVMIVYNHILANFGPLALATLGLCFRINGLVTMILFGIGHGVMPMVAFSEGAGHYKRLVETVRVAVRCSALFSGISSMVLIIFARPILTAFFKRYGFAIHGNTGIKTFHCHTCSGRSLHRLDKHVYRSWKRFDGDAPHDHARCHTPDSHAVDPPPYLGVNGVWLAQPLSTVLAFFMILTISFRQIRGYLKKIT